LLDSGTHPLPRVVLTRCELAHFPGYVMQLTNRGGSDLSLDQRQEDGEKGAVLFY